MATLWRKAKPQSLCKKSLNSVKEKQHLNFSWERRKAQLSHKDNSSLSKKKKTLKLWIAKKKKTKTNPLREETPNSQDGNKKDPKKKGNATCSLSFSNSTFITNKKQRKKLHCLKIRNNLNSLTRKKTSWSLTWKNPKPLRRETTQTFKTKKNNDPNEKENATPSLYQKRKNWTLNTKEKSLSWRTNSTVSRKGIISTHSRQKKTNFTQEKNLDHLKRKNKPNSLIRKLNSLSQEKTHLFQENKTLNPLKKILIAFMKKDRYLRKKTKRKTTITMLLKKKLNSLRKQRKKPHSRNKFNLRVEKQQTLSWKNQLSVPLCEKKKQLSQEKKNPTLSRMKRNSTNNSLKRKTVIEWTITLSEAKKTSSMGISNSVDGKLNSLKKKWTL